ncbi:Aminomethyltransferase beta-barrel domain [Popillia japonica]|uniref:tRNA-5-taurinomethyluridine 2-sulfurtransferase n=1 Tax=Popillia japonica TaxID=7064 RepID=A0AAW1MGS1_POPJA
MYKFRNIVVGMSGGVDSAVAALLLKRYNIQGVFMQNWDITDEQGFCSASEDYKDAKYVCDKLNIPLISVNFVKEYWNDVFVDLIREYENGYTPNPDILCNRHIKFNYFYKFAKEKLNADAIATGHYARTSFGTFLEKYDPNIGVKLLKPLDDVKDQTFFLCQIKQDALRETMFPLGDLTKPQVKQIAREHNLEEIASKKESMGICFIGSRDFQDFISEYVQNKPGKFVDVDTGLVVGEHNGIHHWTLGQRSRIAGVADSYFIANKDVTSNTIYVAMGTTHPALHSNLFFTSDPHWICRKPVELDKNEIYTCQFKFQHTHSLVDCDLCQTPKGLIVKLSAPKRALTPGQYAVFYKGEECLGSARISNSGPSNFLMFYSKNKSYERRKNAKERIAKRLHKKMKENELEENITNQISL